MNLIIKNYDKKEKEPLHTRFTIVSNDHVLFLEHSKDINFRDESEFSMFFTIENLKALKSLIDYQLSLK